MTLVFDLAPALTSPQAALPPETDVGLATALGYETQKTLRGSVTCKGVGVHSGRVATLKLSPAPADSGISFVRTDLRNGARLIKARYDRVIDTRLCTVLGNDHGARVGTVEHLLAALRAYDIDNALIEIDGDEVPIMDGSAAPFMFLIDTAGTAQLPAPRRWLEVLAPIRVGDTAKWAELRPATQPEFAVTIDFPSAAIGLQSFAAVLSPSNFKTQISRARTFGFVEDVAALRAIGLGRGGSLHNAIVVEGDKILNEEGLRLPNEFARHKLLDAVGDLSLAGAPIRGRLAGYCSGHALNNQLLRALFSQPVPGAGIRPKAAPAPPLRISI